jgi:hypothetical protein
MTQVGRTLVAIAFFAAIALAACSEDESPAGQGGAGAQGGMPPVCLGCAQFREACGPATQCPMADAFCDDTALELWTALDDCLCQVATCLSVCANRCAGNMFFDGQPCFDCMDAEAATTCMAESLACNADAS